MRDIEAYKQKLMRAKKNSMCDCTISKTSWTTSRAPIPRNAQSSAKTMKCSKGLGNAGKVELEQIEHALTRIKNGTFGVCVACGEEISDKRLDAIPYATKCKDCM